RIEDAQSKHEAGRRSADVVRLDVDRERHSDIEQVGADGHADDGPSGLGGRFSGANADGLILPVAMDGERHQVADFVAGDGLNQVAGGGDGLVVDSYDDVPYLEESLGRHTVDHAFDFGALTRDLYRKASGFERHEPGYGLAFVDQALVGLVDLLLGGARG